VSDRLLRVRIRTVGQESVTRAVRGITQGARRAQQEQQRSSRATRDALVRSEREATREAQRSARARESMARREAQQRTRLAQQAARESARADAQAAREEQRNANEVFRMRMRLHQQRIRAERRADQERQRSQRMRDGAVAAGSVAAVATVIAGVSSTLDAITARIETITAAIGARAGVQDVGQRTASAQDFELQLARSSGEFFQGVSPEERARQMADLANEINQVALASGQSPTELLNTLSGMQEQFSAFEYGRANLRAIADEAQRTGASMETLGQFVGVMNQQLGETAPTADRAFSIMAEGGLQGAITPESFAQNFGGMLGQFQVSSGTSGEDSLRQFMALANVIRPGAQTDAEAATQMHGLIAAMQSPRARSSIQEAMGGHRVGRGRDSHFVGGTTAFRADGTVDYAQLIQDMSTIENTSRGSGVAAALHAAGARDAMTSLTRAQRGEVSGPTFSEMMSVSAESADRRRAEDLARVHATTAYQSRQMAVQGEVEGIRQLPGRAKAGNTMIAYNEALTQTGMDQYLGEQSTLGRWAPSWVTQMAMPAIAGQLSQLSGDQRASITRWGGALFGAQGMDVGNAISSVAAVGDRAGAVQKQSLMRIQDGARMELGDDTVRRLASAIAPTGPTPPSTPSAPLASAGTSSRRIAADRR